MAPENSAASREVPEHQDQSIKARKHQLFEGRDLEGAGALRPFSEYLKTTPPAPIAPGVKAALWTAGVVTVLLFLAALLAGRGAKPHRARQSFAPSFPAPSAVARLRESDARSRVGPSPDGMKNALMPTLDKRSGMS